MGNQHSDIRLKPTATNQVPPPVRVVERVHADVLTLGRRHDDLPVVESERREGYMIGWIYIFVFIVIPLLAMAGAFCVFTWGPPEWRRRLRDWAYRDDRKR